MFVYPFLNRINGRKLTEISRASRLNLKGLFVTRYAKNALLRGDFLDPGMDKLTNPFVWTDKLIFTLLRIHEHSEIPRLRLLSATSAERDLRSRPIKEGASRYVYHHRSHD